MKEKIMHAAAVEMNQHGLRFTLDTVASALGISKKTIYQYYTSKDDLISQIIEAALSDLAAQSAAICNDRSLSYLERLNGVICMEQTRFGTTSDLIMADIQQYRPADWQRVSIMREHCEALLVEILQEGQALGLVRPMDVGVAAKIMRGAINEFLQASFLRENQLSFSDAMALLNDIFLHGVLQNVPKRDRETDGEMK